MVLDTAPDLGVAQGAPRPGRHALQRSTPRRRRASPARPRFAASSTVLTYPGMICRRTETWKCGPCSYIWTLIQTTSGNGHSEDRRYVDAHSSLDSDRPPCRPRWAFAFWSRQEGRARSDHIQPIQAHDAARAFTLAVDRIAGKVAGCDRYQHGDLRRADRRRRAPDVARGAADRLGTGRQQRLFQ